MGESAFFRLNLVLSSAMNSRIRQSAVARRKIALLAVILTKRKFLEGETSAGL
jgi:hypothetical protein